MCPAAEECPGRDKPRETANGREKRVDAQVRQRGGWTQILARSSGGPDHPQLQAAWARQWSTETVRIVFSHLAPSQGHPEFIVP